MLVSKFTVTSSGCSHLKVLGNPRAAGGVGSLPWCHPVESYRHRALRDSDALGGSNMLGAGFAEVCPSFGQGPGITPFHLMSLPGWGAGTLACSRRKT